MIKKITLIVPILLALLIQPTQAKVYSTEGKTSVEIVALTMLMEARGKGEEGMTMVCNFIMQGANERNVWLYQEALKKQRFSVWNFRHPDLVQKKLAPFTLTDEKARQMLNSKQGKFALSFATRVCNGDPVPYIIGNACNYHDDSIPTPRSWGKTLEVAGYIQSFVLYQRKGDSTMPRVGVSRMTQRVAQN